ncbi:hypothetical protein [Streptomyces sp. KAU_LT]|uniref:hypothetical protein n=1 Tax=Streptomyces sp. KAU_LT TaxID=3046669 RepID=UPI0024B7A08D|nr:hypothetical protein [Streptomyces sp. KAU_LT]MDI9836209.1 hypothetical protein [Streptomyces sp. KAU_LT]
MAPLSLARRKEMEAVAERARAQRGVWLRVDSYPSLRGARTMVGRINHGTAVAFPGEGDWEAYTAPAEDGQSVWVRYVAGSAPVRKLPLRLTVRVPCPGVGPDQQEMGVVTVSISARCPVCGGPRGTDFPGLHKFVHRGVHLTVNHWRNPCGHVDTYEAVLAEGRGRDRQDPADLLQAAYAEQKVGAHATQAANLLAAAGHRDAAALVRGEIKNNDGRLTTLQAVEFLRDLVGGGR